MRAESKVYAGLTVSSVAGDVEFVDGKAEVTEAQAEALRKLPESFGVTAEDAPEDETDGGPRGNASVEDWRAYAVTKGIPVEQVADLKRDEIKQLLAE